MLSTTTGMQHPSTQLAPFASAGLAGLPSVFGELLQQDQGISFNCHETSDAVIYVFDCPGVAKGDVVVQVLPPSDGHARHRLTVRVTRHAPKMEHGTTSWHEGRWTGHQQRTVPLPMWADESALKVTAFEHGVMTIQAPRRAGSAPFPQPRRLSFA